MLDLISILAITLCEPCNTKGDIAWESADWCNQRKSYVFSPQLAIISQMQVSRQHLVEEF